MQKKICILDYGSGNVASVFNCVSNFAQTVVSNSRKDIDAATHLILPGVGSYKKAMSAIKEKIPLTELHENLAQGKPFLGICVGMQALATKGHEFGIWDGLNIIEGDVLELQVDQLRLPHVGWNNLISKIDSPLLHQITPEDNFYFVHSFYFQTRAQNAAIAHTEYEQIFASAIQQKNIYGVQFHPEKSQSSGSKIIKNFIQLS